MADHHVATLRHHQQEVCGLAWSPDGKFLASGGNDNHALIWDSNLGHEVAPLHTFTSHQAAVKVFLLLSVSVHYFLVENKYHRLGSRKDHYWSFQLLLVPVLCNLFKMEMARYLQGHFAPAS